MKKFFLFAPLMALFVWVSFGANYSAPDMGMILSLQWERFSINTDWKTLESIKPFPWNSCTNYEISTFNWLMNEIWTFIAWGSLDWSNTISVNLPISQGTYIIMPTNCWDVGASSSTSQIGGTDLTFLGWFYTSTQDRHFFIQTFSVIDTPVVPSWPNVSFGITSDQTTTLGSWLLNSWNFLFSLFVRLAPFLVAFAIIFIAVSMISRYFMIWWNRKKTKK